MKLVVISPESADARELAVLPALFAAGLERYHVRKPTVSRPELRAWLENVPPEFRPRLVLHQHHDLVAEFGLGGRHWRDDAAAPLAPPTDLGFTSRSCHHLAGLRTALGRYDAVFFGPVFPSISKPGYAPSGQWSPAELRKLLVPRTAAERRTTAIALGGIDADHMSRCRELGFDGVAVLGAVWEAADPVAAFEHLQSAIKPSASLPSFEVRSSKFEVRRSELMCITQDGLSLTHIEQAEQLCVAGAHWIQLRMKNAASEAWLATAREVAAICRARGAVFIVNDNVDLALTVGADGVHLGKLDLDWHEARRRLGPQKILGGTVNDSADAVRARDSGCLDYVGVGPLRFTTTKQKLAPVLGLEGVSALITELGELPAWVIGGVESSDLPPLRAAGAGGVAVSSALFRGGRVAENVRAFHDACASQPITVS